MGAIITLGVISGIIMMHLTQIGNEINGDGAVLFVTAILTFILAVLIVFFYRKDIPWIGKKLNF